MLPQYNISYTSRGYELSHLDEKLGIQKVSER